MKRFVNNISMLMILAVWLPSAASAQSSRHLLVVKASGIQGYGKPDPRSEITAFFVYGDLLTVNKAPEGSPWLVVSAAGTQAFEPPIYVQSPYLSSKMPGPTYVAPGDHRYVRARLTLLPNRTFVLVLNFCHGFETVQGSWDRQQDILTLTLKSSPSFKEWIPDGILRFNALTGGLQYVGPSIYACTLGPGASILIAEPD